MTDRTQHVLDAIDGALADNEFPDAMRWSPAPETVDDAPAPFDGALVWQPPQRYESEVAAAAPFRHRPHCSIVHEYLDRTPSCQCGALDRAALTLWEPMVLQYSGRRRPPGRLSFAPVVTPPAAVGEWTEVGHLVDDVQLVASSTVLTHWQAALLAQVFGESFREVSALLSRVFTVLGEEAQRFVDVVDQLRPVLPEQPAVDEDPRARALRLRQQRNTGPERRPAGQQKRPRRLP